MTGVIVLAAGGSTRLGKPKQLLVYKTRPLVVIAVEAALKTGANPIVVVTGANDHDVSSLLSNQPVIFVNNDLWKEGMALSIITGLSKVLALAPQTEQVLIMLCDQPFVDDQLLKKLMEVKTQTGKGIVSAFYNNTCGVPVLFDKSYFKDLLLLQGQEGARKLLLKYAHDVAAVPFDKGAIDIDTLDDYEQLQSMD